MRLTSPASTKADPDSAKAPRTFCIYDNLKRMNQCTKKPSANGKRKNFIAMQKGQC